MKKISSVEEYYYELDPALIAKYPLENRDDSRLLYYSKKDNKINDLSFKDIVNIFNEGDIIIYNNVKVVPARLFPSDESGRQFEILFIKYMGVNRIYAIGKPLKKLKKDKILYFDKDNYLIFIKRDRDGAEFEFKGNISFESIMKKYGKIPLPPYIDRETEESDIERYQTIFALQGTASAAPTAGLHFTEEIVAQLKSKGVKLYPITLNVGPGTFLPLRDSEINDNKLYPERFVIPYETIKAVKNRNGRLCCVGTTALRTIENIDDFENIESDIKGETNLFIKPADDGTLFKPKYTDYFITNFHLPKTSLFVLVCGLIGISGAKTLYSHAVNEKYRFYSYGDSTILKL